MFHNLKESMNETNCCPKCGSTKTVKHGFIKTYQKYVCKDCNSIFSDKPKKYSDEFKMQAIEMYLNNTGVRKTAMFLKVSPPLVLKWIKGAAKILSNKLREVASHVETASEEPDIIEMDEIYTHIKKNSQGFSYGLLILGNKVVLLRTTSVKD